MVSGLAAGRAELASRRVLWTRNVSLASSATPRHHLHRCCTGINHRDPFVSQPGHTPEVVPAGVIIAPTTRVERMALESLYPRNARKLRAANITPDANTTNCALIAFPMLTDLGWLPPCQLLVGGAEVLLDDSRNLAAKLRREGAPPSYQEYDEMVHVWTLSSRSCRKRVRLLKVSARSPTITSQGPKHADAGRVLSCVYGTGARLDTMPFVLD
ncbi:alpha/beta hydrolase [Arthrobacter sp. 2MCAF14]|uniref:alpha/beta hydrolase n=1 Tax=Arthrobacter sp. 2MCAF14 TaxID=3232982 RepID=UPI003F8F4A25